MKINLKWKIYPNEKRPHSKMIKNKTLANSTQAFIARVSKKNSTSGLGACHNRKTEENKLHQKLYEVSSGRV